MLNRSYIKMALSFTTVSNICIKIKILIIYIKNLYTMRDFNPLATLSLKREREKRRFVGLRIILKFYYGNKFLNQVLNFYIKLGDVVPRYVSIIISSFLGTVRTTFLELKVCS